MVRTGPTNENLRGLIVSLRQVSRKLKIPLWMRIAEELERPTRARRSVNIHRIEKYAKDGETVIVPGKVLGTGDLTKKVKVAAFRFSGSAKSKIKSAMSIEQLLKENPKGKGVRIIG
ncbi:MAG: 50S ribosomal protein L18e [Nanoarchaeota archaeon]